MCKVLNQQLHNLHENHIYCSWLSVDLFRALYTGTMTENRVNDGVELENKTRQEN